MKFLHFGGEIKGSEGASMEAALAIKFRRNSDLPKNVRCDLIKINKCKCGKCSASRNLILATRGKMGNEN